MAHHNELGKLGEQIAADYLESNGYKILEKNWRYLKAEVDIIALKNNTLLVVEVKTRNSNYFGEPEEAIHSKKIALLIQAANAYANQHDIEFEIRFDVISIIKNKQQTHIQHLKDAFAPF